MADLSELEEKIKAMEEGIYNTPAQEEETAVVDETKEGDENNVVEEPQVEQELASDIMETESSDEDLTTQKESLEESTEAPKQKRTNWKKRYINLKSMHDSKMFSFNTELASVKKELVQALSKYQEVSKAYSDSIQKVDIYKGAFTEEEVDIMGEDTINSLKKATKIAVENAVNPLKKELEETKQAQLKVVEADAESKANNAYQLFLSRLEQAVPFYSELDSDPKFISWMDDFDLVNGESRKAIFKRAQSIGDVGRVASFFKEFKELTTQRVNPLEGKVTPESTASSNNPLQSTEPKVISKGYMEQFYQDAAKGKYRGRESERIKIEREIDLAVMEGRITN